MINTTDTSGVVPQEEASVANQKAPARKMPNKSETASFLTAAQIAHTAKEQLAMITAQAPETVSEVAQEGEKWCVNVEMIEMKRIPEASDMLATYRVSLDKEGHLLAYERTRRYRRDQMSEEV